MKSGASSDARRRPSRPVVADHDRIAVSDQTQPVHLGGGDVVLDEQDFDILVRSVFLRGRWIPLPSSNRSDPFGTVADKPSRGSSRRARLRLSREPSKCAAATPSQRTSGERFPLRRRSSRRQRRTRPHRSPALEGRAFGDDATRAAWSAIGLSASDPGDTISVMAHHDSNSSTITFCDRIFQAGVRREAPCPTWSHHLEVLDGSQIQADSTRCQTGRGSISCRGRDVPAVQFEDHQRAREAWVSVSSSVATAAASSSSASAPRPAPVSSDASPIDRRIPVTLDSATAFGTVYGMCRRWF